MPYTIKTTVPETMREQSKIEAARRIYEQLLKYINTAGGSAACPRGGAE